MTEREGCALLKRQFEKAGYSIRENVDFREGEIAFNVDGWDPEHRVGYEYVTTEAGDRAELTPPMLAALDKRIHGGELFLLLIDENDAPTADLIEFAAVRFLEEVARRRGGLAPAPKGKAKTTTAARSKAKPPARKATAPKSRKAKASARKKATTKKRAAPRKKPVTKRKAPARKRPRSGTGSRRGRKKTRAKK